MKPQEELITIRDNKALIKRLLEELVLFPRVKAINWSKITKQTPNMKIGYPGQHLASLITGIEGSRTGARGDDLKDGSEVKSCSRVDQLDSCEDCKSRVLRIEDTCPNCGSTNLKRMDDSKWLFAVKSEAELKLLTQTIDRVFLTIADYPQFLENKFDSIRFQAFEIWNKDKRHQHFTVLMNNYYHKIFLEHIKRNPNKTPAPKNFWPYSYQFYLCNPVKVFEALVTSADTNPKIEITYYVEPNYDRSLLASEPMPSKLLSINEVRILSAPENAYAISPLIQEDHDLEELISIASKKSLNKAKLMEVLPFLDERARRLLTLRDTDRIAEAKSLYQRR
ncbi:MAG: MamI family restriction endonuclease [Gammaproteobacteria bacterium]